MRYIRILLIILLILGIAVLLYYLYPTKEPEPLELPEKEENLILVLIGNERYVVSCQGLKDFVKEHGKKVASKEYEIRS